METLFHWGMQRTPCSMVSTTSFMEGRGGKMNSFCAMNSLRMSFCRVPRSLAGGIPLSSATARYSASRMAAGPLMVIEVETRSRGMSRNSRSMSSMEEIATPHMPTSPSLDSWSESYPMSVGRSKATERPPCPWARRNL